MPEDLILDDDVRVPTRFEVCGRCDGEGSHDPWEDGMTAEEMWEQGDEFIEDYRAGRYAVPCSECKGLRVVRVVDETLASPEELATYEAYVRAKTEYRAMAAAERRAGC